MRPNAMMLPNLRRALLRFASDTRAATAIEYAMIAAGVGAVIAATVFTVGQTVLTQLYVKLANAMQ